MNYSDTTDQPYPWLPSTPPSNPWIDPYPHKPERIPLPNQDFTNQMIVKDNMIYLIQVNPGVYLSNYTPSLPNLGVNIELTGNIKSAKIYKNEIQAHKDAMKVVKELPDYLDTIEVVG